MTLTESIPTAIILLFWLVMISVHILTLLSVAGKWRLYQKAGQAGWKSLIPLYSDYMDFRIAHSLPMFWPWLLCQLSGYFLISIAEGYLILIIAILLLIGYTISFIRDYRLSGAFGHSVGFTLGLFFLRPLFLIILGFGRARYLEKQQKKVTRQ